MVITLFFVNIVLAFIILLCTSMLENHFKKIEHSIEVYLNDKTYKPESQVNFITELLKKYKELNKIALNHVAIETMIYKQLYEEKIGKFQFMNVQTVALRGKNVLWGILVLQAMFEILNQNKDLSMGHFIFIIANTLLCMSITLAGIIKSTEEKKEYLIIKIQDYIVNTYPLKANKKEEQNKIKHFIEDMNELSKKDETKEIEKENLAYNMELKENDIVELISCLNIQANK